MRKPNRAPQFRRLLNLARESRTIVTVCHRRADPDAYCSAFALEHILARLNPKTRSLVLLPEGLSRLTEVLGKEFAVSEGSASDLASADLIILVDVGSEFLLSDLLDVFLESRAPKVLLDHHRLQDESTMKRGRTKFALSIRDEKVSSTSQLVGELILHAKRPGVLTPVVAQSLLTGIIFDSQNLRLADCAALDVVAQLCSNGADVAEVRKLLFLPKERSEAIARLKGAQRSEFEENHGWIVAHSTVSSFQASVARALIELGADVAFVAGGQEEGKTVCSLRATQNFVEKTGIDLTSQLLKRAKLPEEEGGGHPTAATMTSSSPVNDILARVDSALHSLMVELPNREQRMKVSQS